MFRTFIFTSAIACTIVYLSFPALVGAQDSSVDEKVEKQRMVDLGGRFIKAIQANNVEAYHQCWLQVADIEAGIRTQSPGFPKVSDEEMRFVREYFKERNRAIDLSFAVLRRALNELAGGLNNITVKELSGKVSVENGMKGVSMFHVKLVAKNGVQIEYDIDDGAYVNDRWYFSDRPSWHLSVIENGKERSIGLGTFATADEKQMIVDMEAPKR